MSRTFSPTCVLGIDGKFEQLTKDLTEILMMRDSVIVFTQYTDTMDCLRDMLRHDCGSQVACHSSCGGELWDGTAWVGTSKENIKTVFRESVTKFCLPVPTSSPAPVCRALGRTMPSNSGSATRRRTVYTGDSPPFVIDSLTD